MWPSMCGCAGGYVTGQRTVEGNRITPVFALAPKRADEASNSPERCVTSAGTMPASCKRTGFAAIQQLVPPKALSHPACEPVAHQPRGSLRPGQVLSKELPKRASRQADDHYSS